MLEDLLILFVLLTLILKTKLEKVSFCRGQYCLKKDLPCPVKPKCEYRNPSHSAPIRWQWRIFVLKLLTNIDGSVGPHDSNSLADHSLFINCGGGKMQLEGDEYEADQDGRGPSHFHVDDSERWAYSSTGVFIGEEDTSYIARSSSSRLSGPEFYHTARGAPNSLKYYGLCLRKGSYKVRLHFAEIIFTNDQTFSSLGKRIFDVSIQVSESLLLLEAQFGVRNQITREYFSYQSTQVLS